MISFEVDLTDMVKDLSYYINPGGLDSQWIKAKMYNNSWSKLTQQG